jgi:hypothetical protein
MSYLYSKHNQKRRTISANNIFIVNDLILQTRLNTTLRYFLLLFLFCLRSSFSPLFLSLSLLPLSVCASTSGIARS